MYVRFDDLRPAYARQLVFGEPETVLETSRAADVAGVLEEAERCAAAGRWVAGFVAYEAAPGFDVALDSHAGVDDLPLVWFGVFDTPPSAAGWPAPESFGFGDWTPNVTRQDYDAGIDTIRGHIRAGDTYQVNHTLRLRSPFEGDPLSAYRTLIEAQLGGYGAYLDIGSRLVLSASPELFFRWDRDGVLVRPMKGTMCRGRWSAEDLELRQRLFESEKDRAENLMIVDLLRNDLGRIADVGSVTVPSLFAIERYDTVWQMTSTVTARPRPDVGLVDVFRALFPSGSVTGAPKVSTMRIIRDLEPEPRGVYCGAIGFLAPPDRGEPRAQFSVAIRTLLLDRDAASAEYGTGGGITWGSTAADEYDEAMLKARILTTRRPAFELLETFRWEPGTGFARLDRHLSRLSASADYFGFEFDPTAADEALGSVSGTQPLRVRLLLGPDGLRVETQPAREGPVPVRLAVDDVPVDPSDVFLYHKTTRRGVYEAAAARHPEADDVVLVNDGRNVTETTIGSLSARFGDRWVTPPLADGCLPGVLRAEMLEAGKLGERSIRQDELRDADEVAVLSSLRGWRSALLDQAWRAAAPASG